MRQQRKETASQCVPQITQSPPTTLTFSINNTYKPLIYSSTKEGHQINSQLLLGQVTGFTRRRFHHCTCTTDVLECRGSPPPFPLSLLLPHHILPHPIHIPNLLVQPLSNGRGSLFFPSHVPRCAFFRSHLGSRPQVKSSCGNGDLHVCMFLVFAEVPGQLVNPLEKAVGSGPRCQNLMDC